MGLMPGQNVSLETLLYGMMLSSGNDAAIAIAKHVAGSEARFVEMMNAKAKALGLRDTQFKNPHGLDADGHYSSAYDLAIMARYGMQNPTFYSLSNTRHWNARRLRPLEPEQAAAGLPGRRRRQARLHRRRRPLPGRLGGARQPPGARDGAQQRRHDRRQPRAARLRLRQLPLAVLTP